MNRLNTFKVEEENNTMSNVNVYVIHGFMATPYDHWFQWLNEKLEERGIAVNVLTLPDPSAPDPTTWKQTLAENIDRLNENTFLVAHSLGCLSLLTYLQDRVEVKPIGGIILVSGFVSPLPELPQLNSFSECHINFEKIVSMVKQRVVIGSPQDPIVPYNLTENVAKNLKSDLHSIDNAGHFLADDGYSTFPFLLENLSKMISN